MLCDLKAETIHQLDNGLAGGVINDEIARILADMEDRGIEDGKPRTLNVQLEFTWFEKKKVLVSVSAQAKLPAKRTSTTDATIRLNKTGLGFVFRDDNAENVDQPTLDDMKKDGE